MLRLGKFFAFLVLFNLGTTAEEKNLRVLQCIVAYDHCAKDGDCCPGLTCVGGCCEGNLINGAVENYTKFQKYLNLFFIFKTIIVPYVIILTTTTILYCCGCCKTFFGVMLIFLTCPISICYLMIKCFAKNAQKKC